MHLTVVFIRSYNFSKMLLNVVVYNKTRAFTGHTIPIDFSEETTVADVKKAIETATEIPSELQWIIFGIDHLDDDIRLIDMGIDEGYTIYSTPTYIEIPEIPNL